MALVIIPVNEVDSTQSVDLAASSVATIQLDRRVPRTGAHFVGVDNKVEMRLVGEHVHASADLARQPVVFVGAEPLSSSAHERLDGFRRWFGDEPPVLLGSFNSSWGIEAADRLLSAGWRTGTIVTAADVIAIGLLSRLHAAGFSVPEQFRVIGFDGVGVSRLAHPTLTTIRQPVETMSREIRTLIETAISGSDRSPTSRRIRPSLVIGESSPERA